MIYKHVNSKVPTSGLVISNETTKQENELRPVDKFKVTLFTV